MQTSSSIEKPLVICDVDEVLLHFIEPFEQFLAAKGYRLHPTSFRLDGNIKHERTGEALPSEKTKDFIFELFLTLSDNQRPVEGALTALNKLSVMCDVVLLTNFPADLIGKRQTRLQELDINLPIQANEGCKGAAINALMEKRSGPCFFIDDTPRHIRAALDLPTPPYCIHFIADSRFASLASKNPVSGSSMLTRDWALTYHYIESQISRAT